MYFKYILAFLALLISPNIGFSVEEADDVFELTTKVMEMVSKSWEIVDKVEDRVGDVNAPLVWFTKKRERKILTNFGHLTHLVHMTQKETDNIRTMMLSSLKKLQSFPNAVLNGIQINEILESVRSIENDFRTMEGAYYL